MGDEGTCAGAELWQAAVPGRRAGRTGGQQQRRSQRCYEGGSGDQLEEEGGEEEIPREALRTAVMGVAAAAEPPCPRSLALRLVRGRRRGDGDGIMAATLFSWMGGGRAS